jgi:hypothetical protein
MTPEARSFYSAMRCALHDLPDVRLRTVERNGDVLVLALPEWPWPSSTTEPSARHHVRAKRRVLCSPARPAVEWEMARRLRRKCLDDPFIDRRPSTHVSTLGRAL